MGNSIYRKQISDLIPKKKVLLLECIINNHTNLIYVDPLTFEGLSANKKNIILDQDYVKRKLEDTKKCFIYTNHVKAPHFEGQYIELDKEIAIQIKNVEWSFLHKLFEGINQAPYDKRSGMLRIEEVEFKFNFDKEPGRICHLLLGSAQYIKKKRQWVEIYEKVLDRNKNRNPENAMKLKIYRINERIRKKLGYPDLIKYENKTLFVNPDYYYLFKSKPNRTK